MSILEKDCLNQFAVYEANTGTGDFGEATRAAPVEIKVRWELKRSQAVDALGNTVGFDITAVVDRVIVVGSTMWLGRLADYPASTADLKEVVDYQEIPDIKGREFRRTILLRRLSDERLTAT